MRKPAFIIVFFLFLTGIGWGQSFEWLGGAVGFESDWNEGDNWDGGIAPSDGDDILIPAVPGNHYPEVPITISSLGTVDIDGGELTVVSALTINTLTASGGELVTTGVNVSVSNSTNVTGAFTVTGDLTIAGSATISAVLIHTGTLNISGNLNISAGSFSGGTVNFWGGVITASAPGIQINNITGTAGALTAGTKNINVSTNNAGTIDIDLFISSGQKNLTLNGTQNPIITGSGSQFNNIIITGIITTGGNLHVNTLTVNNGAELILNDDASGIGTLNNSGTLELAGYDLTVATSFVNNNLIRLDGTASQSVSSFSGNGTAEFSASGVSLAGITSFHNLTILGGTRTTAAVSVSGDFGQAGSLTVSSGALAMSGASMHANSITGNVNINSAVTASGDINVTGLLAINTGRSLAMASHNLSVSGLTITGTLDAGAQTTLNGGIWNRTGTFNHNNGAVLFNNNTTVNNANTFHNVTCNGAVNFTGSNTFADLTCGSASTVSFAGGSTQTISALHANGAELTSSASTQWNISGLTAANFTSNASTHISYCRSSVYLARNASNATDDGNNIRVFAGGTFTWTGTSSAAWSNDANWTTYFPPVTDNTTIITIPNAARYPVLDAAVACGALTINATASLDLSANNHDLTVNGTLANNGSLNLRAADLSVITLNNSGTILLTGTQSITGQSSPIGGTVRYQGNAASPWILGNSYTNLEIDPGITMGILGAALNISGTAAINSNISVLSITVGGASTLNANITATGGNQTYTGNVTLGGTAAPHVLSGNEIRLAAVTGGGNALTINGHAFFNNGGSGIGALIVNGNADFLSAAFSAASVTVSGTAAVNVNINTTGNQHYAAMSLGTAQHTLTSSGGNIEASGIVTGTAGVTINALHGITMNNAGNTLGSAVALNNTGASTGAINFYTQNSVTITAANNTAAGNTSIGAGTINIGGAGITAAANGSVTLTSGSTVTQGGLISTANLTVNAANGITLNNNANQIRASAAFTNTTAGNIAFTNNTSAAVTLGLHASNGGLGGTINIAHNNGTLNVNATGVTSNAGAITLTGQSGVTINDAVNTGAGAEIELLSANGSMSGSGNLTGTDLHITTNAGSINLAGVLTGTALTASAANGITLNGANHINASASLTNNTTNAVSFTNTSADLGLTAVNNTRAITINQTGALSITSVSSGSLTLDVSGAITATGANSINTLHITRAGGDVEFNNSSALVLDGINASNAGAGRHNVKITTLTGGITQTANLIVNTGLLDLTAAGSISLPTGTGMNAHSVDELRINVSGGTGTVRFVNNRALAVRGITAANYSVEIVNANPVNVTGAVSANELRLETNNTAASADNNITIGAAMTINAKLTIICGHYTPADDHCGTVTINDNITAGTGITGDVLEIQTGNIINNSILNAAGKNVSIKTDEFDDYGTINAVNVSISPRHRDINLVYYSGTPPAFSNAHFGNFFAVPVSGSDNKIFSGYENVYLLNVTDSANRNINISASGFIEFYNGYAYTGSNASHLTLNAAGGIQSYHDADGQTTAAMGSSNFSVSQNIYLERGSLSISANGIILGGNVTNRTANLSADLSLTSGAGTIIHTVNISGNFTFYGNALNGTLNNTISAVNAVINNSGAFTLPSGAHIILSGNFNQSGGGTSNLSANIITSGGSAAISFTNSVVLTGGITLQNENGNITIQNTISGGTFALRVNSRGTVTFVNTVNLAGFTMNSAGVASGNAQFNSTQNYSGNFIFYGGELTAAGTMTVGGSSQIANSGLFTTSANIISNNGFTQLPASAGLSVLSGNISTQGAVITFVRGISLSSDVEFSTASAAAGGNISLTGIEGAGKNFIMSANTANIAVSGNIGSSGALGNITIIRANNADFSGSVNAVSFKQENGAGTTIFNGLQSYSAGFSFNGNQLTVNNALNTDNDTTNNDGAVNIANSGLFTVGSSGNIAPNGTSGTIIITGGALNNGIIAAGPVAAPMAGNLSSAVYFGGNYMSSAAGKITGNTTTPDIQFNANVILGDLDLKNNRLVFSGSGLQQLSAAVSANPAADGNILIMSGSVVNVLSGSVIRQSNARTLELRGAALPSAAAILDVSAGSWRMGAGGTPSNDFAGINGGLILGTGSKLIARNINLTGEPSPSSSFKITNVKNACISAKGNVVISSNVILDGGGDENFPQLVLEMDGNGQQELKTELVLGSLHVMANSQTILKSDTLQEISFRGEVKIFASAAPLGLEAGSFNIVMYSGLKGYRDLNAFKHGNSSDDEIYFSRWEVTNAVYTSKPPFVVTPNINNFVFRQDLGKKISFKRDFSDLSAAPVFFEIAGNTMWQEFECLEPGAVIQFSRHPDHHTILDNFKITGNANDYVTITRLTGGGYDYPYQYDSSYMAPPPSSVNDIGKWALPAYHPPMDLKNAGETELEKYWNINLVSSPNPNYRPLEGFSYVRIFFSHAYNQRIPIEADKMHLDVIPYYRPLDLIGYFNFDWIELRKILYSFTEDYNGNGRMDRIRVQTNISLNGDFSQFEAEVEGYKINRNAAGLVGFQNGYQMVNNYTGTGSFDSDSFYIYLVEDPDIDSGKIPIWSVIRNTSLQDALTGTMVGDPEIDVNIKPFDTIPPRVAYSLTLPGHPQTYMRMSEPVVSGSISGNSLDSSEVIESTAPYTFTWYYFPYEHNDGTVIKEMPVSKANIGYLLNWSASFSAGAMADLKNIHGDTTSALEDGYLRIINVSDQGQRAMDWSDYKLDEAFYIFYQPPKYPLNWKYTAYAKVMGNSHLISEGLSDDAPNAASAIGPVDLADVFIPPNKMLTVGMMTTLANGNGDQITPKSFASYKNPSADDSVYRRITDALISRPPGITSNNNSYVNYQNYFAWPVWAKHRNPLNDTAFNNDDIFWGQQPNDTGIIWEFDGTKYLEALYLEERSEIDLQARINSALGNFELQIYWTTNIPGIYRLSKEEPVRGRSSGGLWLPDNNLLYYLSPVYNGNNILSSSVFSSNYITTYNLGKNSSGSRVDFIFRKKDSDMFIIRFDAPQNIVPNNWYTMVRPFSFDIQDIRRQRGGVTVLNNVINSNNAEVSYIRYHLVRPGRVTIQVYTLDGTLVKSIRRNENRAEGEYTDSWNGTNTGGRPVVRGMYFVRVVAPDIDEIRKIMVVK